jgi:hypothetical protein
MRVPGLFVVIALVVGACGSSGAPVPLIAAPTDLITPLPTTARTEAPTLAPTKVPTVTTPSATELPTEAPPSPTETPAPTEAPTKAPTPEPTDAPTPKAAFYTPPGWDGVSDVNCKDLGTHAHAVSFFRGTGGSTTNDPYRLDADHDGDPCESLP